MNKPEVKLTTNEHGYLIRKVCELISEVEIGSQSRFIFTNSFSFCNIPNHNDYKKNPNKVISNELSGINSLRNEGLYCQSLHGWKRYFIFNHIAINLIEDVTEEAGQNSIWSAALALTSYIELNQNEFCNKRILELGAGCGIVSFALSFLSDDNQITATEQPSCLPYLRRNLKLNPDLINSNNNLEIKSLYWDTNEYKDEPYDIILGCDITYNPLLFEDLICTIYNRFNKNGKSYALLCHDNDSCPLSKLAEVKLHDTIKKFKMKMIRIKLEKNSFYEENIVLWKLILE